MIKPFAATQTRERIGRQTLALTKKNFLIFYRSPFASLFRALLLPILFTAVLSSVNKFSGPGSAAADSEGGIATSPQQIKSLQQALDGVPLKKLVLCRNGFSGSEVDAIFNRTLQSVSADRIEVIDDVDALFLRCRQTMSGISDCFGAVILTSINATNVDYIIAMDSAKILRTKDFEKHSSMSNDRLLPLQWAMDSSIGSFSTASRPLEIPWAGRFGAPSKDSGLSASPASWFMIIYYFVAPVFLLALIGVVYHLSLFMATEREAGITELLTAQTCTIVPRLLSTIISFVTLYFPGWFVCSILMTQLLFTHCSDTILLFLTLLAGTSITTWAVFIASLFRKAQLAGLYSAIITFVFGLLTIAFVFDEVPQYRFLTALGALFPPFTYSALIADVARAEDRLASFSLSKFEVEPAPVGDPRRVQAQITGYLYFVFFIVQIIVYSAAAYAVEYYKWGVYKIYEEIDPSSEIAVKCIGLSKTFKSTRKWYWPCSIASKDHYAVKGLNLELKKGSVNFLLGPNGGGKTTTLKCIAGMITADKTSRLQINRDVVAIGVCPQQNVFWEGLTVREHVKIWRQIKAPAYIGSEELDVIVECDILEKADQVVQTLSGGQQRKVQLAIAFVGGSKMCYIDEASSGLDPLSRRNIWKIISNSHSRRTILITTHFLDEADILSDNISIMHEGSLVATGSATSLKANHGKNYEIQRVATEDDGNEQEMPTWQTTTSYEAMLKVVELQEFSGGIYTVTFPTLDQVFLNVTNSTLMSTMPVNEGTGLEIVRQESSLQELRSHRDEELDLEVGRMVHFSRQILVLLKKRYLLARHSWLSLGLALAVPVVLAGALRGTFKNFPDFNQCLDNLPGMKNASIQDIGMFGDINFTYDVLGPLARPTEVDDLRSAVTGIVGPVSAFEGPVQTNLYLANMERYFSEFGLGVFPDKLTMAISTRANASSLEEMLSLVRSNNGDPAFGIFAPEIGDITLVHRMSPEYSMAGLNIITNRLANSSASNPQARVVKTTYREFRHVEISPDPMSIPLFTLITLGFIISTSISILYPVFEKINNVRALQYSNSVSPAALWTAYILFDMHFGIVTSGFTWALVFAANSKAWYESTFILFAIILFCIATYLGMYVCSLFLKKAAFALSVGVHILLMVLYLVAYVVNEANGSIDEYTVTLSIHGALGLTSPAANLLRTFFIAGHNFGITCGETGWYDLHPIAFTLYGGVYMNLILQIMFLSLVIAHVEYGAPGWITRILPRRNNNQASLHFNFDNDMSSPGADTIPMTNLNKLSRFSVLIVNNISKFFGSHLAVQNVSFDIAADETLALLGANGAGKTTTINMIRGLTKPQYGNITIGGVDASENPQLARIHTGVCPQDDAIDELTVRQTLDFYALIKGLRNVRSNVDKILNAFNIMKFEDRLVSKLSGGTRRKVMVCIAMLGNPKLLLLDEPSTSQDAGAKRVLWKVLQSLGKGRAVLLTTHSMEETEALATKVSIVDRRMLASGTVNSLREKYGGCFRVRASYESGSEMIVERLLFVEFGLQMKRLKMGFGELGFELPHQRREIGEIMRKMEGLLRVRRIQGDHEGKARGEREREVAVPPKLLICYTITEPSMDDVFLNVCKEADVASV